jgi:putative RecB family exonuclease
MTQSQSTAGPVVEPPAGPPEVPRRPALSPSRASDFKQCPLLYRFRAIDRLPEVPSPAQVRGTLVHAVLEQLFLLPAAQRTPQAARALVAPAWAQLCADDPRLPAALGHPQPEAERLTDATGPPAADPDAADPNAPDPDAADPNAPDPAADPKAADPAATGPATGDPTAPPAEARAGVTPGADVDAWLASAEPLLDAYFALEDPRLLEPEARELLVEVELESGLLLRGYVDRVDRTGPDGSTLRVVDYKTGSAPRPVAEARALFQMKFYALALLCLRGVMPTELRLLYLTGPEELRYTPDEAQLRRFARTLDAIWAAIRSAGATGDFRPNPGPSCAWCCHKPACPAWDGVPPPYPGWPGDAATEAS